MKYILWFTMIMMGVLCNANTCNIKKRYRRIHMDIKR